MTRMRVLLLLLAVLLVLGISSVCASARDAAEEQKIQYLITSIENLPGITFLRNGEEYGCRTAADHLRLKLEKAGNRVKTVEDFIRFGSKSYISGKPYKMRYPDGTTVEVEKFFRDRLKAAGY